jgi:hypothetical protein
LISVRWFSIHGESRQIYYNITMILGPIQEVVKHGCISSQSNIHFYFKLAKIVNLVPTNKSDTGIVPYRHSTVKIHLDRYLHVPGICAPSGHRDTVIILPQEDKFQLPILHMVRQCYRPYLSSISSSWLVASDLSQHRIHPFNTEHTRLRPRRQGPFSL